MADRSNIEWTDATVNFWWGCTKVGPGCDHCYAEAWSKRTGGSIWGVGVPRRKIKGAVALILKLQNGASWFFADHGRRRRVFIQSMSDLFDNEVPAEWLAEAWHRIAQCFSLEVQIVTKRISAVEKRLQAIGAPVWPSNAGLMISVVNQGEADRDVPRLIALKQKLGITWIGLSMEPLLGAVMLRPEWLKHLDWVIVGGESGAGARPMHPDWARSLRDQCGRTGTPFFFKQWGEWAPTHPDWPRAAPTVIASDGTTYAPQDLVYPDGARYGEAIRAGHDKAHLTNIYRVGRKAAGRLLDGVEHNGMPAIAVETLAGAA